MKSKKWDDRFIGLAKLVGSWSKDPSTQVGAVIVDEDHRIISIGFNGLPRNVDDHYDRLNNRDIKYETVVHAEANALMFANRSAKNCTLYTWPFQPCSRCAGLIIQSGMIKEVVTIQNTDPRWEKNFNLALQMFEESGIILEWVKDGQ